MLDEDELLTIGAPTCQPKIKFKERRSDFNGQKVSLLNPDHLKQYYQELKSRNENVDNFLQKSFKSRLSTILDFLIVDLNIWLLVANMCMQQLTLSYEFDTHYEKIDQTKFKTDPSNWRTNTLQVSLYSLLSY